MSKDVLATKNSDAIAYFMDVASKFVDGRFKNYKYTHCDLTTEEHKRLLEMNNLLEDDMLRGGEVLRVVGCIETKSMVLTTVKEIELFMILDQINWIIEQRK